MLEAGGVEVGDVCGNAAGGGVWAEAGTGVCGAADDTAGGGGCVATSGAPVAEGSVDTVVRACAVCSSVGRSAGEIGATDLAALCCAGTSMGSD